MRLCFGWRWFGLLVFVGCSSRATIDRPEKVTPDPHLGCADVPERQATAAEREALFEFLTANEWQGTACTVASMLPPTCHHLTLEPSGEYSWSAVSDYPEREDSGEWNFVARDGDSGTLFFSNGSSVLFDRDGANLITSRASFVPGALHGGGGDASGLPSVAPPELYVKLQGTCWTKTNPFDGYRLPDDLAFGTDGSYSVSYRSGECRHGGVFTVDEGNVVQRADDNTCDLRGPSPGMLPSAMPELLDDLLVFYDSTYRAASSPDSKTLLLLDSWWRQPGKPFQPDGAQSDWGSVRVRATYDGALSRGSATPMHFEVENVSGDGVKLGSFSLALQSTALASDGFTLTGDAQSLVLTDFAGTRLAPRETVSFDHEVTPAVWGDWVSADFTLAFTFFNGDGFTNHVDLLGPIAEGVPVTVEPPPPQNTPALTGDPPSYGSCGSVSSSGPISSLNFSPDGAWLSAGADTTAGTLSVWNAGDLSSAYVVGGEAPPNTVYGEAFAGSVLARTYQAQVGLFQASDGAALGTLGTTTDALSSWLLRLSASQDGALLATGSFGGKVDLWRVADRTLANTLSAHDGQVFGLAFAPDGTLATGGADWLVKFWNPVTGELLRTFDEHTDWVSCVAFAEQGALLASGSFDNTVVLWNSADATIRRVLDIGTDVVDCELTGDGVLVVLAGGGVSLYRADDGGGPLRLPLSDFARAMAVSPDGRIAIGYSSGNIDLFCRN